MDPLADKYPEWSTYNYGFDNPIRFIDPDGKGPGDNVGNYFENKFRELGRELHRNMVNFAGVTLPKILDYGSLTAIALGQPGVSATLSTGSFVLTLAHDAGSGEGDYTDSQVSGATLVVGAVSKQKSVQIGAAIVQILYDEGVLTDNSNNQQTTESTSTTAENEQKPMLPVYVAPAVSSGVVNINVEPVKENLE